MSHYNDYLQMLEERTAQGIVAKPFSAEQVFALIERIKACPDDDANADKYLYQLSERVPAGVDEAAQVKASFLEKIANGSETSAIISPLYAVKLLGTMQGGYNISPLLSFLSEETLAPAAVNALSHSILVFDALDDVIKLAGEGNPYAGQVLENWANAIWFTERRALAEKITLKVFKVPGEINTDDLSPAPDAWSRPDIPLHAEAMLKMPREGLAKNPLKLLASYKEEGYQVAFVGDVVGTGSSRKSAANSLIWHIGHDIPHVPNKRNGGVVLGGAIAPIFFNTLEDAGALPVEMDVSKMDMGQIIDIYPYQGKVCDHNTGELLGEFTLKSDIIFDEVQAGGRIPLILGRQLTDDARKHLGLEPSPIFKRFAQKTGSGHFTLAQKMVGKACGLDGVYPGQYCQPQVTTVGSQDTTGPMTRDEIKDLACLNFKAPLVLQTFCHTAPYPRPIDAENHCTLPRFMEARNGVAIRPGDGVIHSWLNRMVLPDTVGTGGDSHTRFPLGISFPAGSGLVAFAAATGMMPLDMPESILVRFKGKMHDGITLRDLVHAIPYKAIQEGLLTVEKKGKKNIFNGKIIEIEGLEDLSVEQAFELADASAERSAAACTIALNENKVVDYLKSNITLLKWLLTQGYESKETLQTRIDAMQTWIDAPKLMKADKDAQYSAVLEIDIDEILEPILCCPNDPDDVKTLSQIGTEKIDEVFIGSCMTNIGHFRATAEILRQSGKANQAKLWLAPPTKMDEAQLRSEGLYNIFAQSGARMEMPGCSLCMGNQAQVSENATVVSTSTRNFPNRLGKGTQVYLASAELAAITATLGHLPSLAEYQAEYANIAAKKEEIYNYLAFDQDPLYQTPERIVIRQ